ncbi:MAG TPA: hypothetical protein VN029_12860 [Sphingomonas sp.]|nr:hypothetical protein [Sphingomonas sp.]
MTNITTIILICDGSEAYAADGSDRPGPIVLIQDWLRQNGWPELEKLKGSAPMASSADIWAHDFNRMGEDARKFADFVLSLEWGFPESVVLTVQPEEGDSLVLRPSFEPSSIWRN